MGEIQSTIIESLMFLHDAHTQAWLINGRAHEAEVYVNEHTDFRLVNVLYIILMTYSNKGNLLCAWDLLYL